MYTIDQMAHPLKIQEIAWDIQTRAKSLTIIVSPLDMRGLMGMAQVLATVHMGLVVSGAIKPHGSGLTSRRIRTQAISIRLIDGH